MRVGIAVAVAVVCLATGTATALVATIDEPASVQQEAVRIAPTFHPDRTPAERAAHDLADLINLERNRRGLPFFLWDGRVAAAALRHSEDMADIEALVHRGSDGSTASERLEDAGFAWLDWGENVGAGFVTPDSLFDQWMASAVHRQHLLSAQRYIGVGVDVTDDGITYWTLLVAS